MQSVARRTSGNNAASFWRTVICSQPAGSDEEGVWASSETFNTSDKPNIASRIIREPRESESPTLVSSVESRCTKNLNLTRAIATDVEFESHACRRNETSPDCAKRFRTWVFSKNLSRGSTAAEPWKPPRLV